MAKSTAAATKSPNGEKKEYTQVPLPEGVDLKGSLRFTLKHGSDEFHYGIQPIGSVQEFITKHGEQLVEELLTAALTSRARSTIGAKMAAKGASYASVCTEMLSWTPTSANAKRDEQRQKKADALIAKMSPEAQAKYQNANA